MTTTTTTTTKTTPRIFGVRTMRRVETLHVESDTNRDGVSQPCTIRHIIVPFSFRYTTRDPRLWGKEGKEDENGDEAIARDVLDDRSATLVDVFFFFPFFFSFLSFLDVSYSKVMKKSRNRGLHTFRKYDT